MTPPVSGFQAISAWYLLPGQSPTDPAIASTPQYKWLYLDPSMIGYFNAAGQLQLGMAQVIGGAPAIATFECHFTSPGESCVVTHNLDCAAPMIGQVIVNGGAQVGWQFSNFTSDSFTVTATLPTDITFSVQAAPPAQIIQGQ